MPQQATIFNPQTGERRKINVGDPFPPGFQLETSPPQGTPTGNQPAEGQKTYLDFINEAFKTPEYESTQKQYDEALAKLTELQAQAPGYLERESQRLETADPVLQQMLAQRAQQTGALFSKPFEAREKYKDIFDPVKREALVSQSVGNIIAQLAGTGGLIEQQRGFAGQRAQTALDALLAQSGLAETALGAAGEKKDFLRQLLTAGAEAEYGKQYTPKSEKEWKDIEEALRLEKKYSTSGTGGLNPNKALSMNEAKTLGVPLGTTWGEVVGMKVPVDETTKTFDDFVKNYQTINQTSLADPETTYQEYVNAQQNYNLAPNKQEFLESLRQIAPDLAPLIRVSNVSSNDLTSLLYMLGGMSTE